MSFDHESQRSPGARKRRCLTALLLGCLLAASSAPAAEDAASAAASTPFQFTNAQDRFAITLPPGWVAMPRELANEIADPKLAAKPGGVGSYGFEPAENTNSLTAPTVTIQVIRSGRIADGFVRMLNNPEVRRRAVLDLVRKDGMTEKDILSITFETNRSRLRFVAGNAAEPDEALQIWHDMVFTQNGAINVTCVANKSEAGEWSRIYTGVLDSLNVDSRDTYKPQEALASANGSGYRPSGFLYIPSIMALLGIAKLISNRFSDRVMSDEI